MINTIVGIRKKTITHHSGLFALRLNAKIIYYASVPIWFVQISCVTHDMPRFSRELVAFVYGNFLFALEMLLKWFSNNFGTTVKTSWRWRRSRAVKKTREMKEYETQFRILHAPKQQIGAVKRKGDFEHMMQYDPSHLSAKMLQHSLPILASASFVESHYFRLCWFHRKFNTEGTIPT